MLKLAPPHMAVNAVDVDGPFYRMAVNLVVPDAWSAQGVIGAIATRARSAGGVAAIVLNCHSYKAKVTDPVTNRTKIRGGGGIGLGTGIHRRHTPLFAALNGLVGEIYLVTCRAADSPNPGAGPSDDGDGMAFCREIAKYAGAVLYASDKPQNTGGLLSIPYGWIDGFEGAVYRWDAKGNLLGRRRHWRWGKFE